MRFSVHTATGSIQSISVRGLKQLAQRERPPNSPEEDCSRFPIVSAPWDYGKTRNSISSAEFRGCWRNECIRPVSFSPEFGLLSPMPRLRRELRMARFRENKLPYGPSTSAYHRFNRWRRVWKHIFDAPAAKSRDSLYLIDSTIAKAHRAASPRKRVRRLAHRYPDKLARNFLYHQRGVRQLGS
jgi:hypothetical protein